jgi:hypothetical protein
MESCRSGELKHASRHHINKQQVIVPIEHIPSSTSDASETLKYGWASTV